MPGQYKPLKTDKLHFLLFGQILPFMRSFYWFFGLFWSSFAVAQGPISGFMVGAGNTDIAATYSYEYYDRYFFGNEEETIENTIQSVNLFIEHGFSKKASIVITLPYVWIDTLNRGFQDASVHLKYQNQKSTFSNSNLSFITAVGLSFPVSNYPTETEFPIGNRSTIFQGRFLVQHQWNSGVFWHLQSGIDFRIIPESLGALPVLIRLGYGGSKIYIEGWAEWYNTFEDQADTQIFGTGGSDWFRVGGTIYYSVLPEAGVFISGAQFVSGSNIGISSRVNTGVVYKFIR